jgi:heme exporter protein D
MMPDLGNYAVAVLSAYGITLVLIAGLVIWTLVRGARVRDALRSVEQRQERRDG